MEGGENAFDPRAYYDLPVNARVDFLARWSGKRVFVAELLHHCLKFALDMQFSHEQTSEWFRIVFGVLNSALTKEISSRSSLDESYAAFKEDVVLVSPASGSESPIYTFDEIESMLGFFSDLFFKNFALYQAASATPDTAAKTTASIIAVVETPLLPVPLESAVKDVDEQTVDIPIPEHLREAYAARLQQELEAVEKEFVLP